MDNATMKLIETVANDPQATFSARATAQVLLHVLNVNRLLEADIESLRQRVEYLESRGE